MSGLSDNALRGDEARVAAERELASDADGILAALLVRKQVVVGKLPYRVLLEDRARAAIASQIGRRATTSGSSRRRGRSAAYGR
ncbi:MAG: hypothetical protein ABI275_10590 [Terrimesophilobacter sp.]